MDYCEFVAELTGCIENRMACRNARVDVRKVIKINDSEKDAMSICEPGQLASATVYLDDLYELYNENQNIEEIADKVIYLHEKGRKSVPEQFFSMYEFENARDYITCRLVNTAVNRKYLEDVPHVEILDLSVIFYCTCMCGDGGNVYSSKINRQLLESWDIDIDSLYELAVKNTENIFGVSIEEIGDACRELIKDTESGNEENLLGNFDKEGRIQMFVLTNRIKNSGAVNMFIGDSMKKIADYFQDNLIIIPSSIHEVLVIPEKTGMKKKEIDEMINTVNLDVLSAEDILSDHCYFYDRTADRITM